MSTWQEKYCKGRLEYMHDAHYAHNLLCLSEGYLKIQMTGLISVKPYFQVALLSCVPSTEKSIDKEKGLPKQAFLLRY